jgi:uncharacterized membrane protein YqaE (UPF0057 family)
VSRPPCVARSTLAAGYAEIYGGVMGCLRVVLAVILPPVGVFLTVGFGLQFWLNIVLTLLGYIPGLVHAIWIIARKD